MPFVDYPLNCSSCAGTGKVRPVCAFNVNKDVLTTNCFNCGGSGQTPNRVYVNPVVVADTADAKILGESADNLIVDECLNSEEEFKKASEEISKIKHSRKSKLEG